MLQVFDSFAVVFGVLLMLVPVRFELKMHGGFGLWLNPKGLDFSGRLSLGLIAHLKPLKLVLGVSERLLKIIVD